MPSNEAPSWRCNRGNDSRGSSHESTRTLTFALYLSFVTYIFIVFTFRYSTFTSRLPRLEWITCFEGGKWRKIETLTWTRGRTLSRALHHFVLVLNYWFMFAIILLILKKEKLTIEWTDRSFLICLLNTFRYLKFWCLGNLRKKGGILQTWQYQFHPNRTKNWAGNLK